MTTVTELINALSELEEEGHGDSLVVLSKDAEGNHFSPFCGEFSVGKYEAESTWAGEFSDDPETEYGNRAVCLWPIN